MAEYIGALDKIADLKAENEVLVAALDQIVAYDSWARPDRWKVSKMLSEAEAALAFTTTPGGS